VILDSYHESEAWSGGEIAGIRSGLASRYPDLVPAIEHLDAKRFPGRDHLAHMVEHLRHKYRGRKVDLLMVLDNPAFDLVLAHGPALFPGAPVVFAGVNGFSPAMIAGHPGITGVSEDQDMAGTLRMGLGLHPGTKKVLAIHDYTASGLAVRREMEAILPEFAGRVQVAFSTDGPVEALVQELKALSHDHLVLLLTYVTDGAGRTFTREESTRLIASASPVPVYAMHETRLGHGIVGGLLLEGQEHGRQAAAIALRILDGEAPSHIPVARSRSRAVLDYQVLRRFQIPEDRWPPDAVVVNRPVSYWQQHRDVLLPAAVVVGVLSFASLLLAITVVRVRRAEAARRRSEEQYRALFEQAGDYVLVLERDPESGLRIAEANEAALRAHGYTREELVGRPLSLLDGSVSRDSEADRIAALERNEFLLFTTRHTRRDGSEFEVEVRPSPIRIGDRAFILSVERDITERTRAERALQARTAQLEALQAVGTEVTRELDVHRLLDLILRRAAELVRASAGVIVLWDEAEQHLRPGVRFGEAFAAMPRRAVALGEGLVGQVAVAREGRIVNDYRTWAGARPDTLAHTPITASLAEPLLYRESLVGVLNVVLVDGQGAFTDGDQRLLRLFAAQAAIAIENARLYAAAQQALAAQAQAQAELVRSEKLRGLGQMAAGIAHDLNNMLATVLGQVEIAKHGAVPPDLQEVLAAIETAASDGAATVRRIQEFARPKGTSPLTPCDLGAIVREVVELARPRWQAEPQRRGVTVTVALDLPALPPIQGYAPELREALTNLIFNAVDAMPHGGTLTLAARVTDGQSGDEARGQLGEGTPALPSRRVAESPSRLPGGCVELRIGDTGIGMPPEIQAKIFEPFFTTKGVQGTGLGLAVVYGIVERHGGTIAVASALGQGTTFALTFQRATEAEAAPAPPAPAAPLLRSPRRLLVVDDEPGVRQTLARLLRHASHQVVEAPDGPAALALLATTPVDLVITDLGMPEMNGWELARRIQAARPGLPVILLTGWQDQAPEEAGDRAAVDAILGKPVQLPALLQAIRDLTETEDRAVLQ
jgi:PAS domain S-box-containing protein